MRMIVGLGNPGRRYEKTRHNVGFMVVDTLAERLQVQSFQKKFGGEAATASILGESTLLLKPMEFMNNSGYAVSRASSFCKTAPDEIVVVHDEIDLPHGALRLKNGGGHGGHNGLRSIIAETGHRDFLRVRVGVGKPSAPDEGSVANYVLANFSSTQTPTVDELVKRAADSIESIFEHGIDYAMNHFN